MAIVQISKIQQRAGNLVDLPQLDNAEFGWATDENRLFIGRTGNTYANENIEVLTSYSNISFSQIKGSDGANFNITAPLSSGQILTYVSSTNTWENYKGTTAQLDGSKLQLGDVANISMLGGAIAYILETDGLGNLSWTPKGTLYTSIKALSNANPIVMSVPNTTPYVNGTVVTITGVAGTNANSIVNGQSFYITLANDYPTSGNVKLYTDLARTTGANGYYLTATANTGIATAVIAGGGTGSGQAAGSNTTVQFNDQNISNGVAGFTFDKTSTTLTVATGNIITGNVLANTSITAPSLVSNIATGTAPIIVTSTTLVPNLFVARANVSEYANTALTTTGTWYPIFVNATSGNLAQGANANLSFNAATGNLSTTLLNVTGNANTGNLGTTTLIATTGNITTINSGLMKNSTSNITIASAGNVSTFIGGNATAQLVITASGANIAGTANIVGNANVGNLGTAGQIVSSIATGTAPLTISSTTRVANLNVNYANVADYVVVTNQSTGIYYPTFVNANTTGNYAYASNTLISANLANGAIIATTFVGNILGNIGGILANGTSNVSIPSVNGNVNLTAVGNTTLTVTGTGANIVGTANVSGNANVGNLGTAQVLASANVTAPQLISNVATGTAPFVVTSTTQVANLNVANAGLATYATTANAVAGANVSGQVGNALVAGTVYTNAQPNINSVGTLTGLTVSGNINSTANILANAILGNSAGWGNLSITGKIGISGDYNSGGIIDIVGGNGNASGYTVGGYVQLRGGNALGIAGAATLAGGTADGTGAQVLARGGTSAGVGLGAGTGGNLEMKAGTSVGTDYAGGITFIGGGAGTGAGTPGNVVIQVATALSTGTTTQTLSNIIVVTSTGANITGTANISGNANIGNLGTTRVLASGNITATQLISNVATGTAPLVVTSTTQVANLSVATAGSATTAGTVTTNAQPNITSVSASFTNLTFANAQTISGNNMTLTTGANTLLGTITGNWSLSAGSKLQATYADLAEYYEADQPYEPGTVVAFGGDKEVTLAESLTPKVAGVVSTNPAYVMNSTCKGEHIVALALQGRVPCKVRGTIHKGDMLVSAGGGYARPSSLPLMGTVIGKALENFEGEGVIEVAIGRL